MLFLVLVISVAIINASPQNRNTQNGQWNRGRAASSTLSQRIDRADPSEGCLGPGTECVPYFMCDNQVMPDSSNLVDIAIDDGPCPGSLDVCCGNMNKTTSTVPPVKLTSQGCGYRNVEGVGVRISGATDGEAQFAEFPWMTAVMEKRYQTNGQINLYLCGGSLIHSRVVITAAHCVAKKQNNILKVRFGEWDTQTTSEPLPYQDRDVIEVDIHPEFSSGGLANDVAILLLDSPVTIAENVKTVCLPPATENFDHRRCFATGWGKDKFGAEGKYQVILKKIDLPIIPQDICQTRLRETRLSRFFELHDSFICAGGEEDKDTCKGDGGSPLVCPIPGNENRYYQAGIVAWGIGCGTSNIPGVYVKVSQFRDWIEKTLFDMGIDQSSYSV